MNPKEMDDEHIKNSARYHWRSAVEDWLAHCSESQAYSGSLKQFISAKHPIYWAMIYEIGRRGLAFSAPHERKMQPAFDEPLPNG